MRAPAYPPPPPYRRPWSLAGLLDHGAAFLAVTLLGWWVSILLEWAGIAGGWWDPPGAAHSQALLRTELAWLRADFAGPAVRVPLFDGACQGAGLLYRWSGLEGLTRWTASDAPASWPGSVVSRATTCSSPTRAVY